MPDLLAQLTEISSGTTARPPPCHEEFRANRRTIPQRSAPWAVSTKAWRCHRQCADLPEAILSRRGRNSEQIEVIAGMSSSPHAGCSGRKKLREIDARLELQGFMQMSRCRLGVPIVS